MHRKNAWHIVRINERGAIIVFLPFLARLYKSTESYCCHFDVGVDWSHFKAGIGFTL